MDSLKKGPPPLPKDAFKQPNHETESPFDVQSSAPPPAKARQALQMPTWANRFPIIHPDHADDLDLNAAVNEFGMKMPREQAEDEAYRQYLYHPQKGQHALAAQHHLAGQRAAEAAGDKEAARKHFMMYGMHAKALGHGEVGAVPKDIQHGLMSNPPKIYKFKAHRGDAFAVSPKADVIASSPAPELNKREREVLYMIYLMGNAVLAKAEKKGRCSNSGAITGSREAARVHHCSCGKHLSVEPKLNRKHAGETVEGWSVRIPAHDPPGETKKGELSATKPKAKVIPCICPAYSHPHRVGGGKCSARK